jgi:hypothetical protein
VKNENYIFQIGNFMMGMSESNNYIKEYYCLAHKPNYDRIVGDKYYKDNVEVDKKGQIVKTKK